MAQEPTPNPVTEGPERFRIWNDQAEGSLGQFPGGTVAQAAMQCFVIAMRPVIELARNSDRIAGSLESIAGHFQDAGSLAGYVQAIERHRKLEETARKEWIEGVKLMLEANASDLIERVGLILAEAAGKWDAELSPMRDRLEALERAAELESEHRERGLHE